MDVARDIARAVVETGRPLVAQTMYHSAPAAEAQREGGIPVYATIEAAAMATAAIVERPSPTGAPSLPAQTPGDLDDGYFGSRDLLAAAGVPFVDARRAVGVEAAVAAGVELGFPVVLKALGTLHKSDAGGVRVGIADGQELEAAARDMHERLAPPEFSVERMAPLGDGVELIVGARQRRAVRADRAGRAGRHLRGGVRGRGDRPRAARRRTRRSGCSARCAAPRCSAPVRGRPALDVAAAAACGGGAVAAGGGAARTSPRSRSTPCWRRPTARWRWTRASSRGRRRRCWLTAATRARSRWSPAAAAAWAGRWRSEFARLGAAVAVAGRRPEPLEETVALIADGRRPRGRACRPTCAIPSRWTRWSRRRSSSSGGVDVLVNNAAGNFVVKAEELSPNGWRAVVSIVLDGGWLCTRAAGRQMIAQGEGGAILSGDRELRLDRRPGHRALGVREGRPAGDDQDAGRRVGAAQHPGEHDLPGADGHGGRRRRALADRGRPRPASRRRCPPAGSPRSRRSAGGRPPSARPSRRTSPART